MDTRNMFAANTPNQEEKKIISRQRYLLLKKRCFFQNVDFFFLRLSIKVDSEANLESFPEAGNKRPRTAIVYRGKMTKENIENLK
jgi:hypothetical protein